LTQFSLTFQGAGQYHAFIYQWNGDTNAPTSNPVGSALFDSGAITAPGSLTPVFFNTPGIALDPTKGYVAFIGAPDLIGFVFSFTPNNPYADGTLTRTANAVVTTPNSWSALDGGDLAFTASLTATAIPEPSTLLTLVLSLVAVIAVQRRYD